MRGLSMLASGGFKAEQRLRTRRDFRTVFQCSIRRQGNCVRVLCHRQEITRPARLGVIIKKKDVNHAVDRNRIRRIAREVFRQWAKDVSGLDVVVYAKPTARHATNKELAACIEQQLNQCKTACEPRVLA